MSPHEPPPTRPQGQQTRGKTAKNRLRRVDLFLTRWCPDLIKRTDNDFLQAYFVDLGYGAEPTTTLESAARLRKLNPNLPVLGVEIDPERVQTALPFADTNTLFRLGGFNLPLKPGETVRLIRAFNVLRQYDEDQIEKYYAQMNISLLPAGVLIEGTSDPYGRIWAANLFRKSDEGTLKQEALVLSTNFRWGFAPSQLQPVLPKNLIHRMVPSEPIYEFFSAWKESTLQTIHHKEFGLRQWFIASAENLATKGFLVDTRKKMLRAGFLIWNYSQ